MALLPRRAPSVDLTDRVDLTNRVDLTDDADPAMLVGAHRPRVVSAETASFEAAFPGLYRRSLGLARKFLGNGPAAEDVAAEALARALMRWGRLDPEGRPGWVLRVTANLSIDVLRRNGRTLEPGVIDLEDGTATRLMLADALRLLPKRQREAVSLRYLADLSVEQTAAALGISVGSVKTHAHRGLAAMREQLGHDRMEVVSGSAD